jgi:hypothetical protein
LTKKTKKIEEKKRKEKKSKENHQKSGLAAVVEMDASNAILMDASLHNYRLDGDGEGDGDGGGDGIEEYGGRRLEATILSERWSKTDARSEDILNLIFIP